MLTWEMISIHKCSWQWKFFCYWSGSWFCCLPCEKIKSDYINADFSQGVMITITIKFPTNLMNFLLCCCCVLCCRPKSIFKKQTNTHRQMIFQGYFLVIYLNYLEIIIENLNCKKNNPLLLFMLCFSKETLRTKNQN